MALIKKTKRTVANRRNAIQHLARRMREEDKEGLTEELLERTKHHFCEGVYAREFFLPKEAACVGRVHKKGCFNVLLRGHLRVAMGEGETQDMKAPQFFVSGPGESKALYAYEDSVFITFHATEETDPDKMMDLFTVEDNQAYLAYRRELLTHEDNT